MIRQHAGGAAEQRRVFSLIRNYHAAFMSDETDPASKPVDLSTVVRGMAAELRCFLGPHIELTVGALASGRRAPALVARGEIQSLLRHLLLDAHDAMPEGGAVAIHTGRLCEAAECAAIVIHEVPAFPAPVREETGSRIRKGRSLGLGACYDSIERAGGHFHVSCRGRETVLTICFPLAE